MENIREFFGIQLRRGFTPMLSALRWLRVTPNQVTIAGTVLNVAAAALVVADHLIYAGIVFLVAGCFDMLDGALARLAQKVDALRGVPRFDARPGVGGGHARRHRLSACRPRAVRSMRLWWCWRFWAASL